MKNCKIYSHNQVYIILEELAFRKEKIKRVFICFRIDNFKLEIRNMVAVDRLKSRKSTS